MTGAGRRDLEPPAPASGVESYPEFRIGFCLEDVYCAYVEWSGLVAGGHPEPEVERIRDLGGWAADELRARGVDAASVDRFEELLAGVPGPGENPDRITEQRADERQRIVVRLEEFLGVARKAVGTRRGRYFDYGVMLSRIGACTRTLRFADRLPPELDALRTTMRAKYKAELVRAVRVLVAFVVDLSPERPRDPAQRELDHAVDEFAGYAVTWLATPDSAEELHRRGKEVTLVAGMHTSDAISRHGRRHLYREPLPRHERIPLAVPHDTEDRTRVESLRQELLDKPVGGSWRAHHDALRELVALSRSVLGPVHPTTLHVQADLAMAHLPAGEPDTAADMLLDIAETALRYYGPAHPTRYLVVAHVHNCLGRWHPAAARQLYEFPLKSLALKDEVPEQLRHPRAMIRRYLGLDAEG
ncbi:hypothetical protein B0I31_1268 [Saccharothrix carnea]|uniref:Tetratricopeptide repeat protein n=1 Tax=Saccharothrix carnea TaxID=1280637 RepID=A0A2P8HID1_SACCR|nr:hypothetical protein [Saccharothrix carnea]PSL45977.1 hypothetical protein B0I31_1268 [Saccharothrix carnea]